MAVSLFSRKKAPNPPPLNEIGQPSEWVGPNVYGSTSYGFAIPEYNDNLAGQRGVRIYDRMRRSSSHVRSSLRMMKATTLTSEMFVQPYSTSDYDIEVANMVEWSLHRMSRPFLDIAREALGFLDFGHYAFEKVWEVSDWTPPYTSADRKPIARTCVTWKDWVPIHPIKIDGFRRDTMNKLSHVLYGMKQIPIPIEKLIFFSFEAEGDDPYGISVLRSAYQDWFYLEWLYKIDAIQKERHAIGIPDIELPMDAKENDRTLARQIGNNMRANEKAVLVRPNGWNIGFMELQKTPIDVLASAKEHSIGIERSMLTQFLSAHQQGARSTNATQSTAFDDATRYVTDFFRGVLNQHIKELVDYNYDVDGYPVLKARRFDETRFRSFAVGLRNFVEPGMITPTPELEAFICSYTDLPQPSKEAMARTADERILKPAPSGANATNPDGAPTNVDGSRVGSGNGNAVA